MLPSSSLGLEKTLFFANGSFAPFKYSAKIRREGSPDHFHRMTSLAAVPAPFPRREVAERNSLEFLMGIKYAFPVLSAQYNERARYPEVDGRSQAG